MGKTAEILRSDLHTVQTALGEVLRRVHPQVPSWRFPERLATDLSLEDLLRKADSNSGKHGGNSEKHDCSIGKADGSSAKPGDTNGKPDGISGSDRVFLLEVTVDRLLLLLQSSLMLWNETEGRCRQPLPLTLSSVIKKYSKRLLQTSRAAQQLKDQLAAKDGIISSLYSNEVHLREECQLLQAALKESTLAASTTTIKPASALTGSVPYEARGSLRMPHLPLTTQSMQNTQNKEDERRPLTSSSLSIILCPHDTSTVPAVGDTNRRPVPPSHTTSTQTTDTALAPCIRCSDTQGSLVGVARCLSELTHQLLLPSQLSERNWSQEAERGDTKLEKWEEAATTDIVAIKTHCQTLVDRAEHLRGELNQQREVEDALHLELCQLRSETEILQAAITGAERRHAEELGQSREAVSKQLSQLEASQSELARRSSRLEQELLATQKEKKELRALLAQIEGQMLSARSELRESRCCEQRLLSSQSALQNELGDLRAELACSREELEAGQLEMNKMTTLNTRLEKKKKSILTKQSVLLQRLEELDQEAESLKQEVSGSTRARADLACQLEQIKSECSALHSQVTEQQTRAEASVEEQLRLRCEIHSLEQQLTSLSSQLETENEKCRLMATHPFFQSDSEGYRERLASLSGRESRQWISANTVHILLLEEQNRELRETDMGRVGKRPTRKTELTRPTPLWQSSLLTEAQSILQSRTVAKPLTTTHPPPQPTLSHSSPSSPHSLHRLSSSVHPSHPPSSTSASSCRPLSHISHSLPPLSTHSSNSPPARVPGDCSRGKLGHFVAATPDPQQSKLIVGTEHTDPPSVSPLRRCRHTPTLPPANFPISSSSSSSSFSSSTSLGQYSVWTCALCDRMFPGKQELCSHQISCCPS